MSAGAPTDEKSRRPSLPLRWRLSLLILSLVVAIGAAFAWTAHREMQHALRLRASDRISKAGTEIAAMLKTSMSKGVTEVHKTANDPAIRRFVTTGEAADTALSTLETIARRTQHSRVLLVAHGSGGPVHLVSGNVTIDRTPDASMPLDPEGVGSFRLIDGLPHYRTTGRVSPIEGGDGQGALSVDSPLTASSAAGVALVERLLGNAATLKLGNAAGDVWTNLSGAAPAPPPFQPGGPMVRFVDVAGRARLGNAVAVPDTALRVWVEFDEAPFVEPTRLLLRRLLLPASILVLVGLVAAGVISSRITTPLGQVVQAAEAVATGEYDHRVTLNRRDEIGRLGSAFNAMADRVGESYEELEARVQARTAELEQARTELDRFFSMSIDLLCIAGVDGRFRRVNPAWEHTLGWTAADLTSTPYLDLLHPDDAVATAAEAARLAAGAATSDFENRFRCKDGSYRWLSWKAAAVPESGLVYAAARDVTAEKLSARELQQRASELAAVNRELEAFSYSVSHDLRAPLRSIDGFGQALLEDCSDRLGPEGQDHLGRIRAAAQHMRRLIDDLLKLARVTRADLRVEPVDLTAMASATLESLAQTEPARMVEWRVQPGLAALGDPRLLQIALTNLLENAWKFTRKRADAHIEVGTHADSNGGAVFFVHDDGAGFDMTFSAKLFGTFQRLHHPAEFPGAGIGLATVQRIVARHGGRIWAEGSVGAGATFFFTLHTETPA
jgi:PAS domain S-box-containing protein